jgi:hypothetical protein
MNLRLLSPVLKNNYEVVMAAVQNFGRSLQEASRDLKDNYDIVMMAVKNKGLSLMNASERLRNDPDIVLTAIMQDPETFIPNKLRNDPDFMKKVNEIIGTKESLNKNWYKISQIL